MKLLQALEIANDCSLETVSEAILNVRLHSLNLFDYSDIKTELNELTEDSEAICASIGICDETLVADAIKMIKSQE